MKRYVVDASVAIKWLIVEEGAAEAEKLIHEELLAPDWLMVECANVLWRKHRQQLLPASGVRQLFAKLRHMPARFVSGDELLEMALKLSLVLDHPVYDCLYLALALDEDALLVTADSRFYDAVTRHKSYKKHVQLLERLFPKKKGH